MPRMHGFRDRPNPAHNFDQCPCVRCAGYRTDLISASRTRLKELRPGVYVYDQLCEVLTPGNNRPAIDDRVVLGETPPTQLRAQADDDARAIPMAIVVRRETRLSRARRWLMRLLGNLIR